MSGFKRKLSVRKIRLEGIENSVWSEKSRKWRSGDLEDDGYVSWGLSHLRINIFYLATFFVLILFLGRLFVLTVVDGAKNRELSDNNRVKFVQLEAERGDIIDRYGKVIARSKTLYFLKKGDRKTEISEEAAKKLENEGKAGEYFEGTGGRILREVKRIYPLGEAGSHVLGYTSQVQAEEKKNDKTLNSVNARGRLGVESTYDSFLQGAVGKRLIEVDAMGANVSVLGETAAVKGRNVEVTVDGDLQKVVQDSLKKYSQLTGSNKGAVVVQNPNTGEVLALSSSPSFNPDDIASAVEDKDLPFFNRAVQGTYPPGSVFKIITALAGLESGKITPDTEVDDVGKIEVGGQTFSNWLYTEYGKVDGLIKVEKAIARSNDVFFYKAGEETGVDNIKKIAVKLGYGQKTGIDLPEEAFGLVPDEVWKKSTVGEPWFLGDTLHLAIGQGFMLTSPLQVNDVTSFVASGKLTKPYLVSKIDKGVSAGEIKFGSKVLGTGLVKQENLQLVREGMKKACEVGGTGFPFFDTSYRVACKTGTAEESGGEAHAWFTVFAPADNPKIALTVVVERGGQGSAVSAPVAKDILDWWFKNRK
jgi:penicillin-binding protein 2